uniref:Uncharacterized protein n=1 Tax=Kwoniella pini CBS 10737 TaxID=1296096 RepID=A0A1B9ID14_9TREE|nr:uncharacterized protein I206_00853 [Kwoniella pini CBS 10737]OCF53548.1 hypothetical protein I206_00853 [Kwoniella pini CBS 10737]
MIVIHHPFIRSTRVSYFALASFLSITLLRSFGSTLFIPFVPDQASQSLSETRMPMSIQVPRPSSFWSNLPFAYHASTSSASLVSTPLTTAVQPDPRLIQQALATLSALVLPESPTVVTATTNTAPSAGDTTTDPGHTKPCCALSIRNKHVALSVPVSHQESHPSIARKLRHKLLRINKTDNTELKTITASVADPAHNCTCSLSTIAKSQALELIGKTFAPLAIYSSHIASFFSPVLARLESELGAIHQNVVRTIHTSVNMTRTSITTAARGAQIVKSSFSHFFSSHTPSASEEIARASAMFDTLSEYVEGHLEALEEQAEAMQEKSMESIYQAKRGLNRLMRDLKTLRGIDDKKISTDVEKDGPLPFSHMQEKSSSKRYVQRLKGRIGSDGKGDTKRRRRDHSSRERRKERKLERGLKKDGEVLHPIPNMEKPSRGKRILDQIHHCLHSEKGAMALVL